MQKERRNRSDRRKNESPSDPLPANRSKLPDKSQKGYGKQLSCRQRKLPRGQPQRGQEQTEDNENVNPGAVSTTRGINRDSHQPHDKQGVADRRHHGYQKSHVT